MFNVPEFTCHGLLKLHVTHITFALMALGNIWTTAEHFRHPIERTTYPEVFPVNEDYARLRTAFAGEIVLNTFVATAAVAVIITNAIRKQAIPLGFELLWNTIGTIFQGANIALLLKVAPKFLGPLSRLGVTQGRIGPDGKLASEDAAASITVGWQLGIMFSIVSVTLMSLHVLWHAVVAFRHLPNHPRVLLEPTPSGWSWNLPEPTIKPKVNGKFADHIEVKVEFSHAVVHPAPIGFKTFTLDAAAASKTEQQQPTTVWGKARSWLERNRRPSTKFDAVTHV